ncbi:MAG: Gfo/Idh/MocA family protein [Dysgonomonas sp.]
MIKTQSPPRPEGQKNVLKLACEPLKTVRIGMIGLGVRATKAINRFMYLDGIEIKALCDIIPSNIEHSQDILFNHKHKKADEYTDREGWKLLCQRLDIDLVYISTDWLTHTPMAVYAMQQGKHVALEVPAAPTLAECWQLVDTAEQTQRHCMMLENCCYDSFELNTLHMAQQGVFGEILHVEGAYIHDLRERVLSNESGKRHPSNWQTMYNVQHTGNPYPTHGLGPVCQLLNIHRGDKMNYLVSMSTMQYGMKQYAQERFGSDSPKALLDYKLGDMNNTLIRTQKGKTILVQHDISNPRPYTRIHLINGSNGYAQKYPIERIALYPDSENVLNEEQMSKLLQKYEHPLLKKMGRKAIETCEERARDFLMDYRLIYCLQNGLPLDQDVYDAVEWSCLMELTEISVLNDSMPVEIPDFTRGDWDKVQGLSFAE